MISFNRGNEMAEYDLNGAFDEYQKECESVFNSLSYEDRLKVFCAVTRLIKEGELEEKRSYRGMLYDKFQFSLDSYTAAQNAGYIDIHNSLFTQDDLKQFVKKFF